MTQLERLRERRAEVISLARDPRISRDEALSILQCSTRALYAFLREEGITWERKPHGGSNQYTQNPREKVVELRDRAREGLPANDLYFNEETELLSRRGVYKIIGATGGVYIGMASWSFRKRFNEHRAMLRKGTHHCIGLQRAYNNSPTMAFQILEEAPSGVEAEAIAERELHWWRVYKEARYRVYNGEPSHGSVKHSPASREKISRGKTKEFTVEERELMLRLRREGHSVNHIRRELKASVPRVKAFLSGEGAL